MLSKRSSIHRPEISVGAHPLLRDAPIPDIWGLRQKRKVHRFRWCLRRCPLLLILLWSNTFVLGQNRLSTAPLKRDRIRNMISIERSFPRMENGYVFSFRPSVRQAGEDDLIVASPAKGQDYQLGFSVPGMSETRISDVSVGPEGQVYIVGSAIKAGDVTVRGFLSNLDLTAHGSTVFFDEYKPERVCVAGDGTLWVLGQPLNAELANTPSGMLRNYTAQGELRSEFLPALNFPVVARNVGKRSQIFLSCGEESVGVYLGPARLWVEIAYGEVLAEQRHVDPPQSSVMSRLVLVHKGEVLASFRDRLPDGQLGRVNHFYRLSMDRSPVSWESINGGETSNASNVPARGLLGRDGDSVVYLDSSQIR